LNRTAEIAETETAILDELADRELLSPIEIRAVRSALQTLIENAIGKSRRLLKESNCPIVPRSGKDAILFLYETGVLEEELYRELAGAIGFRNAMIHDYMNFDESVLMELLGSRRYRRIAEYLAWKPELTPVQRHRIENYFL
jgi:uncharacterized protein YutE (UPF0331/DUF86 family)